MKEKVCNLWLEPADYRSIPASGALNSDGTAVMDSGPALEAKQRFSDLEIDLGRLLASRGNHVHLIRPGLVSFPIKQFRWSGVSLEIVERSAHELCTLVGDAKTLLPRPTGAEAGTAWEEVAKVLAFLPDNILVIQHT
ncbi:MAG: ADP-ribose-binding protein [Phycisphaerae bacterium]